MKDKAQEMTDLRAVAYVALLTPSPLDRYQSHPARRMERDGMVFVASDEPGSDGNVVIVTGPATSRGRCARRWSVSSASRASRKM